MRCRTQDRQGYRLGSSSFLFPDSYWKGVNDMSFLTDFVLVLSLLATALILLVSRQPSSVG